MKITGIRPVEKLPPVEKVVIELTVKEAIDLADDFDVFLNGHNKLHYYGVVRDAILSAVHSGETKIVGV